MIAIVDYGLGNLGSAIKAFRHVGAQAELLSDPAALRRQEPLAAGAACLVVAGAGCQRT